jgi:hypothetical protein
MPPPPRKGGIVSSTLAGPEDADARRAEHLVAGEGEEVDVELATSVGPWTIDWAAVDRDQRPDAVRAWASSLTGLIGAEHVGHRGHSRPA